MLDILFFGCIILYFLSLILHFTGLAFKKANLSRLVWVIFLAGFTVHLSYFVSRGIVAGRMPMANQFEFAMSFALGLSLTYIVLKLKSRIEWITTIALLSVCAMMAYTAMQPRVIRELMPALRSPWFTLHILPAVFSYAAFLFAGCIGVKYLFALRKGASEDEAQLRQMDHLSYRLIGIGILLLTVVILSGAVWAEEAWSSFWSWDPKELWSLITWIVYAIYLHQRMRKKWQGKRMAIFSIVGVLVFLFTFIGVNILLPGLHSYK